MRHFAAQAAAVAAQAAAVTLPQTQQRIVTLPSRSMKKSPAWVRWLGCAGWMKTSFHRKEPSTAASVAAVVVTQVPPTFREMMRCSSSASIAITCARDAGTQVTVQVFPDFSAKHGTTIGCGLHVEVFAGLHSHW